jgi:transposase-like protein
MGSRIFTQGFKLKVIRELASGKTSPEVCREHSLNEGTLRRWKREYNANPVNAFAGKGIASTLEAKNAELERTIGQLYIENAFLKKALTTLQTTFAETKKRV